MNDKQASELSRLQSNYWKAVSENDRPQQLIWLDVLKYWIRREVWRRVQFVMFDTDPVEAANFQTSRIQLTDQQLTDFAIAQKILLQADFEKHDGRRERWGDWLKWVERVIEERFYFYCKKYITAKREDKL